MLELPDSGRGGEKENKVHWVRWSKLSKVKGKEGLGFRDLEAFNLTLSKFVSKQSFES